MDEQTKPTPAHTSRGHHPYGPSQLNSLAASPCYLSRSGTNAAAEAGTAQHEAAESGEISQKLNDEQADAVARALSMTRDLRALLEKEGYEIHEFTEQYLPLDDELIDGWLGTTGGYPDKVFVARDPRNDTWQAYVLDWKFGAYAVTKATHNLQGWAYLLGVRHLLRTGRLIRGVNAELTDGTVVFFSPHRDEEPSQASFYAGDFDRMRQTIVDAVADARVVRETIKREGLAAAENLHLLRTSPKTCAFCARVADCPALRVLAQRLAHFRKPLEIPADLSGVLEQDPDKLAAGLQTAAVVKTWAESYRAKVTMRAFEHPEDTPAGYKLVTAWPAKVVDAKLLTEKLTERFGPEVVSKHTDVPLTPFDKLVSEAAERGQKGRAVEDFRASLVASGAIQVSQTPTVSLRMK